MKVGDIVLAVENGYPDIIGPIVSIDFERDWPVRVRTPNADIGFKLNQLTLVSAQQARQADAASLLSSEAGFGTLEQN